MGELYGVTYSSLKHEISSLPKRRCVCKRMAEAWGPEPRIAWFMGSSGGSWLAALAPWLGQELPHGAEDAISISAPWLSQHLLHCRREHGGQGSARGTD